MKNPAHSIFIKDLDKVFPDARYWMTHREVAKVIPSITDLYYAFSSGLSDDVDRDYLARHNQESWELGVRRLIDFRDASNDHRFFDIQFEQIQKDPFPVLEDLYRFIDEPFTDEMRAHPAWRENTPRDKHGPRTYEAVDFGLDLTTLRARFQFYADRFGLRVPANDPQGLALSLDNQTDNHGMPTECQFGGFS